MARKASLQELALRPAPGGTPLFRWIYEELRLAIAEGRLKPGMRLPSTRDLATQYGVARGTVLVTFEQLKAEGYVESEVGSGTRVAGNLPERFFAPAPSLQAAPASVTPSRARLSAWSQTLRPLFPLRGVAPTGVAFEPNQPALDLFPTTLWSRLAGRRLRRASGLQLGVAEAHGYRPLREAVAAYLGSARAVHCTADQVVIVSGTQQTLDLTARLVLDPGDKVWMEDPGYIGAVGAIRSVGARLVAVPVDEDGLDVAQGQKLAADAKLAYVTPAHEFPLGASLSLERRLALLRWAQEAGAWIFEDDYDSEYRYQGRPLPSMQGLDGSGCVIFAGSFNKMLFPNLRLGYVVLPPRLVEPFAVARSLSDRFPPLLDQAVLCDFITEGHFGQHIRRMREAYAERLETLMEMAATGPLAGLIEIAPIHAGMQTAGHLPPSLKDQAVAEAAARQGVRCMTLSMFQIRRKDVNGLLLGFGGYRPELIREGARKLAKVLEGKGPVGSASVRQ
ncbi:PLP-dependent aminotransferase family protein [Verrucomicrobium sp. BvORR106]|uniref:MocR-like pyridoxine biosynthesis transcription factor PdxR n=1 Tax=Verrucomicrobium sp. BvORR106 TaxID=1403819 RepID=UPI00056F27AA|nr:PLP-dependent aminotransferase family protein [Verrucomicrobium sp. BvORR106]